MADNSVPQGVEMNQLRQEAIRRAREMQARAQIPVNYPLPDPAEPVPLDPDPIPPPPAETPAPEAAPPPRGEHAPPRPRQENKPPQNRRTEPGGTPTSSLNSTFDFLTRDPERAMILLLMLILMEEKADNSLLFALMYLLS